MSTPKKSKRRAKEGAREPAAAAHARPTASGPASLPFSTKSADDVESKMAATAELAVSESAALVAVPPLVSAAGFWEGCRMAGAVPEPGAATPADGMRAPAETAMSLPAPLVALWNARDGILAESGVSVYSAGDRTPLSRSSARPRSSSDTCVEGDRWES